jgi:hypothetical protein
VGAKAHFSVINREVCDAASELKELLARISVLLILLHGVRDRLLGQAVLELKGGDWQASDEEAKIQ